MRSVWLVVVAVLGLCSAAHADRAGDVTAAFTVFVHDVAAGKAELSGVDLFLGPASQTTPLPDPKQFPKLLPAPKISGVKVAVAKAGNAAWLVADLSARLQNDHGKPVNGSVRASAVLALVAGTWRVRAAHWSVAKANEGAERCGMIQSWNGLVASIPDDVRAPVQAVSDAIANASGPFTRADAPEPPFVSLLSDDPSAVAIGSAPGERWTGGAAIKKLFRRLGVMAWRDDNGAVTIRAGKVSEDLIWMIVPVRIETQCTYYRAFFVLQKEARGWRIVHQHYSEYYYPL